MRISLSTMFVLLLLPFVQACDSGQTQYVEVETPLVRFGVIADVQYCDCPSENNGRRNYRASRFKLSAATARLNELYDQGEIAFTIHLGDLIDRDRLSFGPILSEWDRLNHPAYLVPGNHDMGAFGSYLQTVEALRIESPTGRGYYSFHSDRAAGWRFIVLDGNDASLTAGEGTLEHMLGDSLYALALQEDPTSRWHNGGLSPTQMSWLRNELQLAAAAGEQVVAFCHFPLQGGRGLDLWNGAEVVDLLRSFPNVRGFFAGHDHEGFARSGSGLPEIGVQSMLGSSSENQFGIGLVYDDQIVWNGQGKFRIATAAPLW